MSWCLAEWKTELVIIWQWRSVKTLGNGFGVVAECETEFGKLNCLFELVICGRWRVVDGRLDFI